MLFNVKISYASDKKFPEKKRRKPKLKLFLASLGAFGSRGGTNVSNSSLNPKQIPNWHYTSLFDFASKIRYLDPLKNRLECPVSIWLTQYVALSDYLLPN